MMTGAGFDGETGRAAGRVVAICAAIGAVILAIAGTPAQGQSVPPPPSNQRAAEAPEVPGVSATMPEELRERIDKVAVIAQWREADDEVGGTYGKETAGLIGGMADGSQMGRINKQIGPVPVNIPIPILTLPGAIFGGLSGATKREIQDFRDALTEQLVNAESPTLTDDGLALDVFWGLRRMPALDSKILNAGADIPADTDAVLHVTFGDVGIDVQGKEAIITTTARATLRRLSDDARLYSSIIHYRDRDTLRNWTADDTALWRNYSNYARHYLGREVAAEFFDRVQVNHEFELKKTRSASIDRKNRRQLNSKSTRPELAWEMTLVGNDADYPWTSGIDERSIAWDVEIYDRNRLVYFEEEVPESRHAIAWDLEPCQAYRWSVRPVYTIDGRRRFGEWMRFAPEVADDDDDGEATPQRPVKGISGRQASVAPAYIQDFAALNIACP